MKKQVSEMFADTVQSLEDNELMTQQQQTYNSSYHTTIHMARVRQGVFTCDGWQVTLSDPICHVTSRSSETGFPGRAILAFTFTSYHRSYHTTVRQLSTWTWRWRSSSWTWVSWWPWSSSSWTSVHQSIHRFIIISHRGSSSRSFLLCHHLTTELGKIWSWTGRSFSSWWWSRSYTGGFLLYNNNTQICQCISIYCVLININLCNHSSAENHLKAVYPNLCKIHSDQQAALLYAVISHIW